MRVFLIAAVSADGFIAPKGKESEASTKWTSAEDSEFFQKMTKEAGVCVMGKSTFDTVGKPLPGRLTYVYTHDDLRFKIFDSRLVQPTSLDPKALITTLKEQEVKAVAICGGTSIYTQFLKAGVVTDVYLTTEPVFFGDGVRLFSEALEIRLAVQGQIALSDHTTVTHYTVQQ